MHKNFLEIKNVNFQAGGKNKVKNVSFNIEKRGDIVLKHSNTKGDFFNLGIKNDWKKLLNNKIVEKIENTFSKEMKELGYL